MRKIILILTLIAFASCSEKECCVQNACMLEPETGPCRAYLVKYYYDKQEKQCREFIWGGCKGVVPFHTLEECKACEGN